jgi:hypothetical protein
MAPQQEDPHPTIAPALGIIRGMILLARSRERERGNATASKAACRFRDFSAMASARLAAAQHHRYIAGTFFPPKRVETR